MSDFNFAPIPEPPSEVQTPNYEPPRPEKAIDAWLARLISLVQTKLFQNWFIQFLTEIVGAVIGVALSLVTLFIEPLVRAIITAKQTAQPALDELSRLGMSQLFDIEVPAGQPNQAQASQAVGKLVMTAIAGQAAVDKNGNIVPSAVEAQNLIALLSRMSLEGWLMDIIGEGATAGAVDKFGNLSEKLSEVLGLGSLASAAIGPAVDIGITTPLRWKLNQQYRPTLLSARLLRRAEKTGKVTHQEALAEAALQGLSDKRAELLFSEDDKNFSLNQLDDFIGVGAMQEGEAVTILVKDGWTEDQARALLAWQFNNTVAGIRSGSASVILSAYANRQIDDDTFLKLIPIGAPDQRLKELMINEGVLRRDLNVSFLSEGDMEKAVKTGLRSLDNYRALLERQGYGLEDIETKELLLLADMHSAEVAKSAKDKAAKDKAAAAKEKADAAAAKKAEADKRAEAGKLSNAQYEQLVRAGKRTLDQYETYLRDIGFSAADAVDLGNVLLADIQARAEAQAKRDDLAHQAKAKNISLGDVESAVLDHVLTLDDYRAALSREGYGPQDTATLVTLLQNKLDDAAAAKAAKDAAAAELKTKDVSLSDIERAVRTGLRTIDQYNARLLAEGFTPDSADLLTALLQAQLDTDQAARDRRDQITAAAAKKKLSLPQIEQAVRGGVKTMADYRAAIAAAGFGADDQNTLAALLELQLDQDAAAKAAHDAAVVKLSQRHVSLANYETAVKLGIVSTTQYRAFLGAQGFTGDDMDLLVSIITTEIAATNAAKAARAAANAKAPQRELSETQMRAAVLDHARTIFDYQTLLRSLGYSEADVVTLSNLLQLELDQRNAATDLQTQVDMALASKSISLSDFRAAVKAKLKTLDDYGAFLSAQGYGGADVQTLVDLLDQQTQPKVK